MSGSNPEWTGFSVIRRIWKRRITLAWFFKQIWKFHLLKQEWTFSRGKVARTPFLYMQPLSPASSGSGDAGTPSFLSLIWNGWVVSGAQKSGPSLFVPLIQGGGRGSSNKTWVSLTSGVGPPSPTWMIPWDLSGRQVTSSALTGSRLHLDRTIHLKDIGPTHPISMTAWPWGPGFSTPGLLRI